MNVNELKQMRISLLEAKVKSLNEVLEKYKNYVSVEQVNKFIEIISDKLILDAKNLEILEPQVSFEVYEQDDIPSYSIISNIDERKWIMNRLPLIKIVYQEKSGAVLLAVSEEAFLSRLVNDGLSYKICDKKFVVSANLSKSTGEGERLVDVLKRTRDEKLKEEEIVNGKCVEFKKVLSVDNVNFIINKIYKELEVLVKDVQNPVPDAWVMLKKYDACYERFGFSRVSEEQISRLVENGFLSSFALGRKMFKELDKSDLYFVVIDNVSYFVYKDALLSRLEEEGLTYKCNKYACNDHCACKDDIHLVVSINLDKHVLKL